jgi:hypothetical protein
MISMIYFPTTTIFNNTSKHHRRSSTIYSISDLAKEMYSIAINDNIVTMNSLLFNDINFIFITYFFVLPLSKNIKKKSNWNIFLDTIFQLITAKFNMEE